MTRLLLLLLPWFNDYVYGSNNIVVFLTIQYYCLSLRHE